MTFDFYGQPFTSSGRYTDFLRVADPGAMEFTDRLTDLDPSILSLANGRWAVDPDGDGATDYTFRDRDFNVRELRTNAVLRWEYRPGSRSCSWCGRRRATMTS